MKERLEAFELHRQQVCKKANTYLLIGIVLLVLGLVLMFLSGIQVFLLLIVVGGILIIVNLSMKSSLSRKFKIDHGL